MGGKIIEISYLIGREETVMPSPTIRPPAIRARSRIAKQPQGMGGTETKFDYYNNTSFLEMFLHAGTHIDTPFHIHPDGISIEAFKIEDFIFNSPLFINLPKTDFEEITKEDLSSYHSELRKSDLVLIYTGFSQYRESDIPRYQKSQPTFTVDSAKYLVNNSSIRAVGIDVMGIENIGKARPDFPVHKIFLRKNERFFVIEDMNLAPLIDEKLRKAYIIPLNFKGAEAMPVRAFAEVE